jgi:hypothetical protein
LVVNRLGQAGIGRHRDPHRYRGDLVGSVADVVAPPRQDLTGVSRRVHHAGERDDRTERVGVEVEMGDHPEVPAATTQRPEQVRVAVRGRDVDRPIGAYHGRCAEAVDGKPVLASYPTLATAEREATDTRLGDNAAGYDQAESLRFPVHIAPHGAALHGGPAGSRVDGHRPHPREVDDDADIAAGVSSDGVPASPHRDEQVALPGEVDGVNNVGSARGAHLERWAPPMHAVVDRIGIEALVAGRQHIAAELHAQCVQLVVFDLGLATVERRNHSCHLPRPLPVRWAGTTRLNSKLSAPFRPSAPVGTVVHPRHAQSQGTPVRGPSPTATCPDERRRWSLRPREKTSTVAEPSDRAYNPATERRHEDSLGLFDHGPGLSPAPWCNEASV